MIPTLFIAYITMSVLGLTLFKMGSTHIKTNFSWTEFYLSVPPVALLGLLCYAIGFILWFYILSKVEMSYISPLAMGITTIAIFLVGVLMFKESVSITKIVGVGIIVTGVIIMNIKA